jgi:ankyrin repeat protein
MRILKGIVAATLVFVSIGISYTYSLAGVNEDLLEAADKGDSKTVQRCLANYADVNAKRSNGVTPLMVAAYKGNAEVIALLITKGADVNAQRPNGDAALSLATDQGHVKIFKMLEYSGAYK